MVRCSNHLIAIPEACIRSKTGKQNIITVRYWTDIRSHFIVKLATLKSAGIYRPTDLPIKSADMKLPNPQKQI